MVANSEGFAENLAGKKFTERSKVASPNNRFGEALLAQMKKDHGNDVKVGNNYTDRGDRQDVFKALFDGSKGESFVNFDKMSEAALKKTYYGIF